MLKILYTLLFFLTVSVYGADSFDRSKRREPLGKLGVTMDFTLATKWPDPWPSNIDDNRRNFVFTSHLKFNSPVTELFTEAQLWQMARDAHAEMRADQKQYKINAEHKKISPLAMALLAWDNEIILASSQKGLVSFTYDGPKTPVLESLLRCQTAWIEAHPDLVTNPPNGGPISRHKTGGQCGEEMSAHLYYLQNVGRPLKERNAVMATVISDGNGHGMMYVPFHRDPCGANDIRWGCNRFVVEENLRVLGTAIEPKPYSLDGIPYTKNQYELCGNVRTFDDTDNAS